MNLSNQHVAVLLEQGFEDLEFWVPRMRLEEAGARVTVVDGGRKDQYEGKHGLIAGPDRPVDQVEPDELDGVVIPGGWAPDKLRRNQRILGLVEACYQADNVIGSICHAGWVPISAGLVEGHEATGTTAIKDDLENAGATWRDEAAFRDDPYVWGRVVEDIPDFCRELTNALSEQAS